MLAKLQRNWISYALLVGMWNNTTILENSLNSHLTVTQQLFGLPCGSGGKESACSVGYLGLISGLGSFPGEENGYPLQYSGLENSTDRGAWQAIVHEVAKSRQDWATFTHSDSLGNYLSKMKPYVHIKTYTWLFIEGLFGVVKTGNNS